MHVLLIVRIFVARRKSIHDLDNEAREEARKGENKKKFTIHDLKGIKPLTTTQEEVFHADAEDANLLLRGSAGTGKSFLAFWLALRAILTPDSVYDKIVIVRSAVAVRDMGALPGEESDKFAPYERPSTISVMNYSLTVIPMRILRRMAT